MAAPHRQEADPDAPESEVVDQQLQRRAVQAQIDLTTAEREFVRKGTRERKARADAETKHEGQRTAAAIANEERRTNADLQETRRRMKADRDDRRARTRAKLADRRRRTKARMSVVEAEAKGIEIRDETWRLERRFWMGVTAFGLVCSTALAFFTADTTLLEYRLSPLAGLAISIGGGVQLRLIARALP